MTPTGKEKTLKYNSGFGNEFATEAVAAVPLIEMNFFVLASSRKFAAGIL